MHTPSITVIQSSVNVPTMPPLLSKIHLVDQCCSPKCLFHRRLNVPTKEQKQSTERAKEIFGRGMVLIRWVAMLCTRQGSALGLPCDGGLFLEIKIKRRGGKSEAA